MFRMITLVTLTMAFAVTATANDSGCGTFGSKAGEASIDLAPPVGYVEICGQDAELCAVLTSGYPASVTTLGYFVTPDEWKRYKTGGTGFTNYLIAQLAGSMSPADLAGFKDYIRSNQGSIPDH